MVARSPLRTSGRVDFGRVDSRSTEQAVTICAESCGEALIGIFDSRGTLGTRVALLDRLVRSFGELLSFAPHWRQLLEEDWATVVGTSTTAKTGIQVSAKLFAGTVMRSGRPSNRANTSGILVDRAKRTVTVYRDAMGMLPIYVVQHDGLLVVTNFAFAGLAALPWRLNSTFLFDSLCQRYADVGAIKEGMRLIKAGECIQFLSGSRRDWDGHLCEGALPHEETYRSEAEFDEDATIDQLYEAMRRSLSEILGARGEAQIYLSDGIDSNLIAGILARDFGIRVIGYTIPNAGRSISTYSVLPALKEKLERIVVSLGSIDSISRGSERCCRIGGGILPFHQGAAKLKLAAAACRDSLVLTGDGADELFGGYPYMYDATANSTVGLGWVTARSRQSADPRDEFVSAMATRIAPFLLPEATPKISRPPAASITGKPEISALGVQLRWDQATILQNYFMRYLGVELDYFSGVACRHPFLDPRVVEIANRIPPTAHFRDGRGKYLLRELGRRHELLTEEQLRAPKVGFIFDVPGGEWARVPEVARRLSKASIEDAGVFRPAPVVELLDQVIRNRADSVDLMLLTSIWHVQVLADGRTRVNGYEQRRLATELWSPLPTENGLGDR